MTVSNIKDGESREASQLDLRKIERRLFRSSLQDGLAELFAGIYLIVVGFAMAVNVAFVAIVIVFGLPWMKRSVESLKRRYTYPRMGYVSFRESEEPADGKRAAWLVLGLLVFYLTFLIGSFFLTTQIMGYEAGRTFWYTRVPSGILGIGLSACGIVPAYLYGVRRWYAFGVLALASGFLVPLVPGLPSGSEGFRILLGLQFTSLGIVAGLTGLVLFLHFVRNNAVVDEGALDGSA